MELKFNNTSWQEKKNDHNLIVKYSPDRFGWSIDLIVAIDDKILLHLDIKNKQDLMTFWKLMHIAGVMMSKGKIEDLDRIYFIADLNDIGVSFPPDSELANNAKADQFAQQMQKYGRDLWELLGKSNLMFLLS